MGEYTPFSLRGKGLSNGQIPFGNLPSGILAAERCLTQLSAQNCWMIGNCFTVQGFWPHKLSGQQIAAGTQKGAESRRFVLGLGLGNWPLAKRSDR